MSKIIFLGTCAGTEPMPDRHHASVMVESNGYYYLFDAGEGCSRTAHLMGIDMSKLKAIFISHPHIDHIGGLLNTVYTVWKLATVYKAYPPDRKIDFHIGDIDLWNSFEEVLSKIGLQYDKWFEICPHEINDGLLFEDENIRVEAMHNHHIKFSDGEKPKSYSFKITVDGKTILYSGDVRDTTDLENVLGDGCDVLIAETGHHKVKDICDFVDTHNVGQLLFSHNGRAILNDEKASREDMRHCTKNPIICYDKMVLNV